MRFTFDQETGSSIVERTYFGEALARPLTAPETGGFVVWSPDGRAPRPISGSSARLSRGGDAVVLRYADRRRRAAVQVDDPWFAAVRTAYGFQWRSERYVFVDWGPDPAGVVTPLCESNFSIYRVGRALELVATNSHACDS